MKTKDPEGERLIALLVSKPEFIARCEEYRHEALMRAVYETADRFTEDERRAIIVGS